MLSLPNSSFLIFPELLSCILFLISHGARQMDKFNIVAHIRSNNAQLIFPVVTIDFRENPYYLSRIKLTEALLEI